MKTNAEFATPKQAGPLGWLRRIVIAEYYQWKAKIKQPREAASPKFLQHNQEHKSRLINPLTSPA